MAFIQVEDVSKSYKVYVREKGMLNGVKSLFHREYAIKDAVKNINFQIERGEAVGYIGMNGAGKSTTIKMLSGILTPSQGKITVGGLVPYEKRKENARQMGVVFGQRSRLNWDLPMSDTFELYRRIYDIDKARFEDNLKFYTKLLGMEEFINRPVRQLSLGEKMRANLTAALLHDPSVVYLDEPTIGLDVVAKGRIRDFITGINKTKDVTVILTTHDMPDIEQICRRIIFIHQGQIFFDGSIDRFRDSYGATYRVVATSPQKLEIKNPLLRLESHSNNQYVFVADKHSLPVDAAFAILVNPKNQVTSVKVEEASIESIVAKIVS